jgi:hypothetical protein
MANKFTLKGHQIEVDYTIGANPAFPALVYKEGSAAEKTFKPNEITTDATALGSLVSVPLVRTVDTGGKIFAFLLPDIDVPRGQTATFETVAMCEEFSGPNSVPHRPTTWKTFVMKGTAQTVIVPLERAAS